MNIYIKYLQYHNIIMLKSYVQGIRTKTNKFIYRGFIQFFIERICRYLGIYTNGTIWNQLQQIEIEVSYVERELLKFILHEGVECTGN